jgi:hypothetical protein
VFLVVELWQLLQEPGHYILKTSSVFPQDLVLGVGWTGQEEELLLYGLIMVYSSHASILSKT